jgi:hypothetical protein
MKTLLINKEAFLDWYFDHETKEDFFYHYDVLNELAEKGEFKLKLSSILDEVGYLPDSVVEEGQHIIYDDQGDVDISAYNKIKFS